MKKHHIHLNYMKATKWINDIKEGKLNQRLKEIYVDEQLLDYQKERYIKAINEYITLYQDDDVDIISVPGRSEICGNHTDHQHGEVLAAAINLDMIAVVSPNEIIEVLSDGYPLEVIELNNLSPEKDDIGTSRGLIRGVVAAFKERGYNIGGFKAYMCSDVLQGSGLSSSAAYEVMIGTILSYLYNEGNISPLEIAQIGQYSENVYFNKPCGLMDQCACSIGQLIYIDFSDPSTPIVEKIDIDFNEFKHSLCIIDVHASHADLTPEYAAIPSEMGNVAKYFHKEYLRDVDKDLFYQSIPKLRKEVGDRAVLRAMHFYEEDQRVEDIVTALKNKDLDYFKAIIYASGQSSFKYLQNIYASSDPQNQAVSLALALSEKILENHGVCRIHGGGFAGTIQAFVEDEFVEEYKKHIEEYFGKGSCHILKIRQYGGIMI